MNLLESYIDEQLIKSWTIFCEPPAKDGANFPYSYRDEKHPLEHWWFDKIADKSYLAELLSEHLMEFYLKAF